MKCILITGGTIFVSKYVAKYFQSNNYEVYVLNSGTKEQIKNIKLICADRNNLKGHLKQYSFDAIINLSRQCELLEEQKDLFDGIARMYIYLSMYNTNCVFNIGKDKCIIEICKNMVYNVIIFIS